jgi:hypothetical protein
MRSLKIVYAPKGRLLLKNVVLAGKPSGIGKSGSTAPERIALHPQRLNVEYQGASTRSQLGSGRQGLFPSPAGRLAGLLQRITVYRRTME